MGAPPSFGPEKWQVAPGISLREGAGGGGGGSKGKTRTGGERGLMNKGINGCVGCGGDP